MNDVDTQAETAKSPAPSPGRDAAVLTQRFVALSFCRADILLEIDNTHNVVFSAGTTPVLLGKSAQELAGTPILDIIDERDQRIVSDMFATAVSAGARIDDVAIRLALANGKTSEALLAGYRVPDFNNHLFLAIKVSPRKVAPPRRRDADHDDQSGVLNADAYRDIAADRIRAVQQAGGEAKMTMVKVNNLDEANLNLSEEGQSKLLSAIGDVMNAQSLGGDSAGRIGDEHFSFVHSGDIDSSEVERQIEAAAKDLVPEGVVITSDTETIEANPEGLSDDQIAKAITYTMRRFSENKGVGDATLSGQFQVMMKETMESVEAFRKICLTRDFDLHFMPICNLKTGKVHHVEALTRFRGEFGASGSPYELITLAEEIGIISEFDLAVARKAVDVVQESVTGKRIPPIAINVSGHSIANKEFVSELRDLLRKATNLSHMISLEITESAAITDFELVNGHIQEFRERGFHVSLDDFGAGAASFDYLNSFDIDVVKFDGPVVQRAHRTEKGKAFLASMATLCNQIGVETIAEMVEDQELADFLLECGIHYGQGWHFGKPVPDINSFRHMML
jgi:EAL domain-containing protein (putative c-di-GMP-specific phosphodiesterase class I)/GGDEF domain-containing protein